VIERTVEAFEPARFAVDGAGRVQGWNPAAERLLGYAAAEACGLEAARLFRDPDALSGLRERASRDGLHVCECALVARSGVERPAIVVVAAGPDGTLAAAAVDGGPSLVAQILLESAGEAAIVSDAARAVVIAANRRACEVFGRTPEEFTEMPVHLLMPPAIGPDMAPRVTRALDESGVFKRDGMSAVRRDGTPFQVDLQIRRVTIAGRRYSLATFREVKERARQEEFLRVLFEQARESVVLVDAESFTIRDINEAGARRLGYDRAELVGRPIRDIHPAHDVARAERAREEVLATGGKLLTGLWHRRKDGTEFPVEISTHVVEIEGRRCFLSMVLDVSQRIDHERRLREAVQHARAMEETARRQTAELAEAKGFLEALQENASDGISVLDESGKIIYCNSQGAANVGLRPEHVVGRFGRDFLPAEARAESEARFRRAMETGEPMAHRTSLPAPGGSGTIELDVKSTRVMWGGRPYLLSIVRDVTERVRAERELAEAKGLMEAVQESATDAIYLLDADGVIVSANSRALAMMNRERAQVVGRHFNEFSPPGLRAEREMMVRRVLAGEPQRHRTRMHPPGRDPIEIDATSNRVMWNGRAYVFSVVRDVTAQVRAQERLELYRQIIANTNEGVAILDTQGRYVEQNAAHEKLLGYAAPELTGRTPAVHLVEPAFEIIAAQLARDGVYHGEVRSRTKRESIADIELSAFAVRDEGGEPVCFVGIHRDITERKRAARRLAAQHAATRVLAEAATLEEASPRIVRAICECLGWEAGAVWTVDRRRDALTCAEFWHVPAVEVGEFEKVSRGRTFTRGIGLPGRVWEGAVPAWIPDVVRDANFPRAPFADRAGLHGAFGFPIVLGREVLGVIEFFSREIRPPDDDLLAMMGAVGSQIGQFIERRRAEGDLRDAMTETRRAYARLKRTQEQLVRSERLASAGMLLSGVAHEINNPINVILGNLKLVQARCARVKEALRDGRPVAPLVRPVPGMLADALSAAENAHRVIAEFRAFARDPSLAEEADINACVEGALSALAPEMRRVRLVKKLGRLPAVRCVPGQVQHAVRNLVKNALEAMDGRGTLTVSTSRVNGHVRIAVADTGRGIPKADLERVFEPFFTTKAEGRGLGLGLPICVTIAQNHGGRLSVRARPGRGTTALLDLAAPR